MQIDELREQMLAGEPGLSPVDVRAIRARGRSLRWQRRAVKGVAALAAVGLIATGAVFLQGGGGVEINSVPPAAAGKDVNALTAYEQRVLDEVPESFAVNGTVVVPGAVSPTDHHKYFTDEQVDGRIRPLGVHLYTGVGYMTGATYPSFMEGNQPEDSQLRADNGPSYLGCVEWDSGDAPCLLAVLVKTGQKFAYGYGFGTDNFLKPGAKMEVFISPVFDGRVQQELVIGGFDGTSATRVELTLEDGSRVDATLASGDLSEGNSIFWTSVAEPVASITAYDAEGGVVITHEIKPCKDPVDCEVR